jgi:hypothetical protein
MINRQAAQLKKWRHTPIENTLAYFTIFLEKSKMFENETIASTYYLLIILKSIKKSSKFKL